MPGAPDPSAAATQILARMQTGDEAAKGELITLLYRELHAVAGQLMRSERREHTLQPTALVSEAFVRLLGREHGDKQSEHAAFQDRVHFIRVAARAMRNVLVDHARARLTERRGGGGQDGGAAWRRVTFSDDLLQGGHDSSSLIRVEDALTKLDTFDPQLAAIVEMRFFGGMTGAEIGSALSMSERGVQRAWRTARAWLTEELDDREAPDS